MSKYAGVECPYCRIILTDEDELAVCPECGTPHHRSCYKLHGECANAHMHGTDYEWRKPRTEDEIRTDVPCPACGRLNSPDNIFCNYCGADIRTGNVSERGAGQTAVGGLFDELTLPTNFSGELFGFSLEDWKTYIGPNQYFYLYHIDRQQRTGKKVGFSIAAALFPFLHFMYRRLWVYAGAALVLNIVLGLPMAVVEFLAPMGMSFGLPIATWETLAMVCSVVMLLVNVVWGIFEAYFYRVNAVKRMSAFKSAAKTEEEFKSLLKKHGGPSRIALMSVLGVLCAVMLAATFGMGF